MLGVQELASTVLQLCGTPTITITESFFGIDFVALCKASVFWLALSLLLVTGSLDVNMVQ